MSVRKLKTLEASASMKGSRERERQAILERSQEAEKGYDASDKRFLDSVPFMRRRFMKLSLGAFSTFTKQVIITGYGRGVISEGQAKILLRSVDNRLWPEGRR